MNRYYVNRKSAVLLSIALASLIVKPIPVATTATIRGVSGS